MQNEWWNLILNGQKKVEGRLFKNHHAIVKVGDDCEIKNSKTKKVLYAKVNNVTFYASFESMLVHEGIKNMLPGIHNLKDAVDLYHKIPNYKNEEKEYGVVAIELTNVKLY